VAEDSPENLQTRLASTQTVRLRLRGEAADLLEAVRALDGVRGVDVVAVDTLDVRAAVGDDIRPALSRLVIESGHDLLEMQTHSMSLEDIFLQLTQESEADDA
jgi:ABC-2 type transport system ATP-binding protein